MFSSSFIKILISFLSYNKLFHLLDLLKPLQLYYCVIWWFSYCLLGGILNILEGKYSFLHYHLFTFSSKILTLSFFQHSNYVRLSRFFTNYMHEGHSSTSAALSIPRRLKCSVISQFEWKRYLKLGSAVTFIDSDGH